MAGEGCRPAASPGDSSSSGRWSEHGFEEGQTAALQGAASSKTTSGELSLAGITLEQSDSRSFSPS